MRKKTIASTESINSLIENTAWNICPRCNKDFILISLMPRGNFWEIFYIDEDVLCPDCSPDK